MKPIWQRYESKERDEKLGGFWVLFAATLISLLGVFFFNIVCLLFVIVFGLFAMVFLQGYARPKLGRMLDDCKRAQKADKEYKTDKKRMYLLFLLFSTPYYFLWQVCSLLLILGAFWASPVTLWFMTSFPALFISTVILIPWKEKWSDLGGKISHYWRMHILVYLATLLVSAIVFALLVLFLGIDTFIR